MAGYFIYTLDGDGFSQLTTNPTDSQARTIADYIHNDNSDSHVWPNDIIALTNEIKRRLALDDWYAGLSDDDAGVMDDIVFSLLDNEIEKQLGVGFECSDYESIYWDCADLAAAQGATMMQEPTFGSSGFRFSGDLAHGFGYHRIYSIFNPEEVKELLVQLQNVEPYFASLSGDGEGGVREQFFQGLLPPVKHAAKNKRYLFIQTDT